MDQGFSVHQCDLEPQTNNPEHHTEQNGVERLIVRRGQPFTVTLHLQPGSRFENGVTAINLVAQTGPNPSELSGTKVKFGLTRLISTFRWSATAAALSEEAVSLTVCPHPSAPIGRYELLLDQGEGELLGEFILLFNTWSKRDSVFMISEEERQEYVLTQDGLIYKGNDQRIISSPWTFGQFEPGILDICLSVLDKNPKYMLDADQDCSERSSPAYVTRVISAMINHFDDQGVLVGNWSGDFDDGVPPYEWRDSATILRQWDEEGSVCYGQCWVFAAVACTVSRALGIPCRVVTNYGSAHDSNGDLLIKRVHTVDDENITDDSIWNFHVWVESWMTRPDLKLGYEGWQVSDPTPQEQSEGVFCCGPAPVRAVREGELTLQYDVPFVYAEVNADVVEYVRLKDGKEIMIWGSTSTVGKCISTKALGKNDREDITHLYKYPEGSEEERTVFEKANHENKLLQADELPGLHIEIILAPDLEVGCDFDVSAIIRNNTPDTGSYRLMFYAQTVTYNGKLGPTCGLAQLADIQLASYQKEEAALRVEYSQYSTAITSDRMIRITALLIDNNTREIHRTVKTVVLDSPDILVTVADEQKLGQPMRVFVRMRNPLPEPLENCCFTLHGANLRTGNAITEQVGTVGADEFARATFEFTPLVAGKRYLMVDLTSDKLCDVSGYSETNIVQ